MRHSISYALISVLIFMFSACATVRYVPVETVKEVAVHDTTYVRADTVRVEVPVFHEKEVVPIMDTLFMESSLAEVRAWADTSTRTLKGTLDHKKAALEKEIIVKERVVYRDSVVTKEVPVEVEKPVPYVPRFWRFMSAIGLAALAYALFRLLRFFKVI